MHIHILGIGGTFMSALALLARAKGYRVSGHDTACYPPISDLLLEQGISYIEGYAQVGEMLQADVVVVGNAMKRGMPIIETLMNARIPYTSGPEWLAREVLKDYKVLAVAGTHGKTSTSTLAAFILEQSGLNPGYLIGGVPQVLEASAKLGQGEWFVIEADEYDTAFFDKRPKFMHYRPYGLIMHNLEFDHADIYDSLASIQRQFHYLLRTVPGQGWVIRPNEEPGIDGAMQQGVYSQVITWGFEKDAMIQCMDMSDDGREFTLQVDGHEYKVSLPLLGRHNAYNAIAALLACYKIGVSLPKGIEILQNYQPVKRRLEVCYSASDLTVYDDFAHHPTAIRCATEAVAKSGKHERVLAILDFASNSMRAGHHLQHMPQALTHVDILYVVEAPGFDIQTEAQKWPCKVVISTTVDSLIQQVMHDIKPHDAIVMMSNKGFDKLKTKLIALIEKSKSLHLT